MSDFRKFLDEQLEDPEFKAEWDALQPERALVQAIFCKIYLYGRTLLDIIGFIR